MSNKKSIQSDSRRVSGHRSVAGFAAFIALSFTSVSALAESAPLDGAQLYNSYCAICHKSGLNAAPKFGSKPLWMKRVAQGKETVYANAINGLRGMPARGGFAQLTDEEVKAATDYLVNASGGWGK